VQVEEYSAALEEVLIKKEDGMKYMPELYAVPANKVSQHRVTVAGSKIVSGLPLGPLNPLKSLF